MRSCVDNVLQLVVPFVNLLGKIRMCVCTGVHSLMMKSGLLEGQRVAVFFFKRKM